MLAVAIAAWGYRAHFMPPLYRTLGQRIEQHSAQLYTIHFRPIAPFYIDLFHE